MFKKWISAAALTFSATAFVTSTAAAQEKAPENWFNLAPSSGTQGLGTEAVYNSLLKGRTSKTVVVAVLDSGVEPDHEDLKDVMWVNEKEAKGKAGVDDDGNGYVDDVHGWNFIGGAGGKNVGSDTYEMTRLVAKYGKMFAGKTPDQIPTDQKAAYKMYEKALEQHSEKVGENQGQLTVVKKLVEDLGAAEIEIKKALGKDTYDEKDLETLSKNKDLKKHVSVAQRMMGIGYTLEELKDAEKHFEDALAFGLNPEFDPRSIVGDNYDDLTNRFYGNNDVEGPDASHGTHVAGIIGAKRNNGKGMNGVADNVRIMSVRCVPDGDERDKDVANAIRYAVDNGAQIINMSFGKGFSPQKEYVDEAVRYARDHDVLLVHAAGNDANNNDQGNNYPLDVFAKKGGLFKPKTAANWMEIGALSWMKGDEQLANFSNFGKKSVDIFSPGKDLYSTVPNNSYKSMSGTSMAAPASAGVAAMLRSYFPELTAEQVKSIILQSVTPINGKIKKPGTDDLVEMKDLCVAGGFISAEKAVKLAMTTKGKKKVAKPRA